MTTRPIIDRSRSSSRTRIPTLQSLSQPNSRSTSPIPSSPHLRSALKHHSPTASPLLLPTDPVAVAELDSVYTRRVAFDTFESETVNKRAGGANFSISAKSRNYHRLGSSRTFLVCSDLNSYSWHAVEWTLENLLEDMDELVILRVIEPGTAAGKQFDGGPDGVDDAREDADVLLAQVMAKDTDLQVGRTFPSSPRVVLTRREQVDFNRRRIRRGRDPRSNDEDHRSLPTRRPHHRLTRSKGEAFLTRRRRIHFPISRRQVPHSHHRRSTRYHDRQSSCQSGTTDDETEHGARWRSCWRGRRVERAAGEVDAGASDAFQ